LRNAAAVARDAATPRQRLKELGLKLNMVSNYLFVPATEELSNVTVEGFHPENKQERNRE
jgi:hypothetical protein